MFDFFDSIINLFTGLFDLIFHLVDFVISSIRGTVSLITTVVAGVQIPLDLEARGIVFGLLGVSIVGTIGFGVIKLILGRMTN